MAPLLTVSVANMLPGTTEEDILDHFKAILDDCKPTVGPLVSYEKRKENGSPQRRIMATVTFRASADWRTKLHNSKLYPSRRREGYGRIIVERGFSGVTHLKDFGGYDFDVYFVHGLGGHAFNTWKSQRKGDVLMWPRDLLPDGLEGKGLKGRYSTIGYEAAPFNENTIAGAAENLLESLRRGRQEGDRRPIFFVCHSLGGLVVCKALGLALWKTDPSHERHRRLFLTPDGDFLVRGVAFFGTPFQGSRLADFASYAASLQQALGGRRAALVSQLKSKSSDLNEIVGEFKQLCLRHKIKVKVYYEKRPLPVLNLSFWVTRPMSAMGSFSRHSPTGLAANHRTMVKFDDQSDSNYKLVEGDLAEMIRKGLEQPEARTRASMIDEEDLGDYSDDSSSVHHDNNGEPAQDRWDAETEARSVSHADGSSVRQAKKKSGLSILTNLFKKKKHSASEAVKRRKSIRRTARAPARNVLVSFDETNDTVIRRTETPPAYSESEQASPIEKVEPSSPRKRATGKPFHPLREYDTVFILDDTSSMAIEDTLVNSEPVNRWECLLSSIQVFGDVAAKNDDDGIDVRFLVNRDKDLKNVRTGKQLLDHLAKIKLSTRRYPKGVGSKEQSLNAVLRAEIGVYMLRLREEKYYTSHQTSNQPARPDTASPKIGNGGSTPEKLKKLNIIIITAGDLDEYEEVERTLVTTARDLEYIQADSDQVGVQFVHVGTDKKAAKWLTTLDDHLRKMYGVRDIVDTRDFDAGANYDDDKLQRKIKQILLGGVDRSIDEEQDV